MPSDFWLALTAIGTFALAATTFFLGLQSRDSVRLGQAQGRLIEEQTRAVRDQAAIAREELEEMRRRDRPALLWDQGEMQPQFMWEPYDGGGDRTGVPLRIRIRCRAINHGGPAFMTGATVRGDGDLDVETPQKHVPAGGSSYFVDIGFGGLKGGEPYQVWAVLTQEYESLSTGERGVAQVLVSLISKWHGLNDPFVLLVPLETEEAKSDAGIARWRDKQRADYDEYIAARLRRIGRGEPPA